MTIILFLLWILSIFATLTLIVTALVFTLRKKKSSKFWISSGLSLVLCMFLLLGFIFSVPSSNNQSSKIASSNESNGTPIKTDIGKQAEKRDQEKDDELDLSEYNEADLKQLNSNGYEKHSKIKISNAQVLAVVEATDEEIGNNIVVAAGNLPAVIYDMSSNPIEKGAVYTLYGSPNEDGKMILVDYEQTEDVKPFTDEKIKILSKEDKALDTSDEDVPSEWKAALKSAENYADILNMSRQGIYNQLTSEVADNFPEEAAQYAYDNIEYDWNDNALKTAQNYQEMMNMSHNAIYDQLIFEEFTPEEAQYAVDNLE